MIFDRKIKSADSCAAVSKEKSFFHILAIQKLTATTAEYKTVCIFLLPVFIVFCSF